MYDHIFYTQVQISRSDIRPHIKWAVSLVILHMVTSIFLQGLCGYIWVNILTLLPQRAEKMGDLSPSQPIKVPLVWLQLKVHKSDQENAEGITVNSKDRSQQPIAIYVIKLMQRLLQQALNAQQPWMSIHREDVCITEAGQNFDPNSVNYGGEADWKEGVCASLYQPASINSRFSSVDDIHTWGLTTAVAVWQSLGVWLIICTNQACNLINKVHIIDDHVCMHSWALLSCVYTTDHSRLFTAHYLALYH